MLILLQIISFHYIQNQLLLYRFKSNLLIWFHINYFNNILKYFFSNQEIFIAFFNKTALHIAVENGFTPIVHLLLLRQDIDVNATYI